MIRISGNQKDMFRGLLIVTILVGGAFALGYYKGYAAGKGDNLKTSLDKPVDLGGRP